MCNIVHDWSDARECKKWPSLQREGQMKKREKCEYDKSNKEVVRYFLDGADEWVEDSAKLAAMLVGGGGGGGGR